MMKEYNQPYSEVSKMNLHDIILFVNIEEQRRKLKEIEEKKAAKELKAKLRKTKI